MLSRAVGRAEVLPPAPLEEGDTEALVELVAADAAVYGDGGGKAPSLPQPLVGAERVAKALIGWGRQAFARGFEYRPAVVNGAPGVVFYDPEGAAIRVAALEPADAASGRCAATATET